MLLAWHKYGGGKELLDEALRLDRRQRRVLPLRPDDRRSRSAGSRSRSPRPEDFKGLKFRTNGLAIDLFTGMGAAVNALPGGEIVPALDRGLLDGAEFNNATSDRILGFPDVSKVCMLQSYHQSAETFEISFNKTEVRRPAGEDEVDHRLRRRSGVGRHVAGRRSTAIRRTTSSCRPRTRSSSTRRRTRSCRPSSRSGMQILEKKSAENPLVQGDRRLAESVRRARGEVGSGHLHQPAHGGAATSSEPRRRDRRRLEAFQHRQSAIRATPGWPISFERATACRNCY